MSAEPVFFSSGAGLTVAEIASLTGGKPGRDDDVLRIHSVAPIDRAGPGQLTFLENPPM